MNDALGMCFDTVLLNIEGRGFSISFYNVY